MKIFVNKIRLSVYIVIKDLEIMNLFLIHLIVAAGLKNAIIVINIFYLKICKII